MDRGKAAPAAPGARWAALDLMRGLTVIGMIVVNAAAGLQGAGGYNLFPTLLHSTWAGFTLADSVFPAFVIILGVSIPVALRRPGAPAGLTSDAAKAIGGRALRLVLLGLVISNLDWLADPSAGAWRAFGVLQRLGLVYAGAAILFHGLGPRVRLAIAAGLLVGYAGLLNLPIPDGHAVDLRAVGVNFVSWSERAWLGPHAWRTGPWGYDPEGPLSTLPCLAQALIGVAAGEVMITRGRGPRVRLGLAATGLVLMAAGLAWSLVLPPIKSVWSSSFVLISSGPPMIGLSLLSGARAGRAWPGRDIVAAFGANAIFAYGLHELAAPMLDAPSLKAITLAASAWIAPPLATLMPIGVFLAILWAPLAYLQRRGWIIKI